MMRVRTIVIGAFVLRLVASIVPAIWYDEAFSLHVASLPVAKIITVADLTPPLWELVIHPFVMLWHSVIVIRLVALVFSMASLWLAWRIMQALKFDKNQITLSMLIMGALPGLVWMASDGRAYAMLECFYMAGIWFVLKANRRGLLFISVLMGYTHVTGILLAASLFLYAFLRGFKARSLIWLGVAIMLAWSPWLAVAIRMVDVQPFTKLSAGYFIGQLAMSFWVGSDVWLWLAGLVLIAVTMFHDVKAYSLVCVPTFLIIVASMMTSNLITYRTLSPILIPFCIATGRVISRRSWLAVLWAVAMLAGVVSYDFDLRGSDQAEAAELIRSKPGRVVYATLTVALPFDYYIPDLDTCLLLLEPDAVGINPNIDWRFPRCTPADLTEPYWFVMPDDPLIPAGSRTQMRAIADSGDVAKTISFVQMAPVGIYRVGE